MTVTNGTRPIVLMDQPDDLYCEERGWVSVDAGVDQARDALVPFCYADDGRTHGRPVGDPKRVWLAPMNPAASVDEQRWVPCDPSAAIGVEFWQFDTTDVEAVASSQERRDD